MSAVRLWSRPLLFASRPISRLVAASALLVFFGACNCEKKTPDAKDAAGSSPSALSNDGQSIVQAPPDEPPSIPMNAGDSTTSVFASLSACSAPDCAIEINFSQPVVDKVPTAVPGIQMRPSIAGSWAWKNTKTLVFTPVKDAMGHGQSVELEVPSIKLETKGDDGETRTFQFQSRQLYVRVPYLRIGMKVAYWPVTKGAPRIVLASHVWTGTIGRGALVVGYDQPIDLTELASKVVVTKSENGAKVPIKVRRPEANEYAFEQGVPPAHFLAIALDKMPATGTTLNYTLPSFASATEESLDRYDLTVATDFHVDTLKAYSGDIRRVPTNGGLTLKFTTPQSLERIKAGLSMTPKPKRLNLTTWDTTVNINGEFENGTEYTISLDSKLRDALGNPLTTSENAPELVFRTKDHRPQFTIPRGHLVLERGNANVPFRVRNVGAITVEPSTLESPAAFAAAMKKSRLSDCNMRGVGGSAAPRSVTPKLALNARGEASIDLKRAGLYCLSLTTLGRGTEAKDKALRRAALVQVTALSTVAKVSDHEIFAWVTSLSDAKVVAGAEVQVLAANAKRVLGKGVTGADGTVRIKLSKSAMGAGVNKRVFLVTSKGDDTAVSDVSVSRLTAAWQFGQTGAVPGVEPLRGALFSERGVYRPGEKVYIKLMAHPEMRDLATGGGVDAKFRVTDARGRKVYSDEVHLDGFASASTIFKLPKEGTVGRYSMTAKVGRRSATASFRVEEYRVPTFEVRMSSEAKTWQRDAGIEVLAESRYMHGARMPGREVRYSVTREPVPFVAPTFPTYRFDVAGAVIPAGEILRKQQRLDGMGQARIAFEANHPAHVGPMRYVVDASVTDVDRQVYAGRISKTVHAARFYVGVDKPSRNVVSTGETINAKFAAVFTDGRPMSGAKLKARLERIDHHQTARIAGESEGGDTKVDVDNHAVETTAASCKVTTRNGKATCKFKVTQPGRYRVRVWARDKDGRDVQAGYELTATGSGSAAWPRYERARIEVVADKADYKPGDVAKLVVESPFDVATGLLTLERDGVRMSRVFEIRKDTPAIEIPVTADMAPNVYATIVLTRGRIHDKKDATGFETGAPAFRVGVANLEVRPAHSRLTVEIEPKKRAAHPGQKVGIDIVVKDHTGAPASAQVTLMVVDEAVLGMTRFKTPDPIRALYAKKPWNVRTFASVTDLPHARRERKEALFPGGDGGDGTSIADFPAELRKLFDSTALFLPDLVTNASGRANAEVTFPDNLTTYRIMAIVIDNDGRSGSEDKKIVVRKPLMVQPVIPRFVYPGDEMKVEALVVNGSDATGEVELVASIVGAKMSGDAKPSPKTLEHGQETVFSFPVSIPSTLVARRGTEIVVRFAGKIKTEGGAVFTDAVEKRIPVFSPGTKRSKVVSQSFASTGTLTAAVPADRVPGSLVVEVVASATMLSELKDAVGYLMQYPNGCIEQTTSTAYPLVLLEDLLPEMGVEVNQEDLKKFRDAGIKRILSFQTTKGGLSYWPGEDKPHAFATAFGLTALLEAKSKGYDIPADKLSRMADYLEETLKKKDVTETIAHGGIADADSRALFVMSLGRLGRPQHAKVSSLWASKEKLTAFGLAFLATAIEEGAGDKALLQPVLDRIQELAKTTEQEAYYEGARKGGYSMDSPLRSHAGALLAFATAAPETEMSGKLLKGLFARRRGGMWGNTQENVFGIMGVAKLSRQKESGAAAASPTIKIGAKSYTGDALESVSKRVKRARVTGDATGVSEGEAGEVSSTVQVTGPSYVTLRAEWEAALTPDNRAARANGFRIKRRYETVKGAKVDPKSIALGSVVRVRITVTSDAERNYVAVDDKVPAGLEPMNMNLATTEKISLGEMTPARARAAKHLSFQEMRDHRVAFFVDEMPAGEYEFVYLARATTPGHFLRPAAHVEAMYETDKSGDTVIDEVDIR